MGKDGTNSNKILFLVALACSLANSQYFIRAIHTHAEIGLTEHTTQVMILLISIIKIHII